MQTYTTFQRLLHWLMGLTIIGLFYIGFFMVDMPSSDQKWAFYGLHKSFGFLVLIFFFVRLSARFITPPNIKNHSINSTHLFFIKASIPVLYIIILIMPLSGFIMSDAGGHPINLFGVINVPSLFKDMKSLGSIASWIHHKCAPFAAGIVVVHMLAALFHHFVLKDNTLKRMIKD